MFEALGARASNFTVAQARRPPSAAVLATVSSSNQVGRKDLTPMAVLELRHLISSRRRLFFLARARCLSAGLRYLRLTSLPRHDHGLVPGGSRSAASCLCTVLRRALYHYATRSPFLTAEAVVHWRNHPGWNKHIDVANIPRHIDRMFV